MSKKYNLGSDHEKYLEANFMSQSNLFLAFPFLLPDTSTASSATSTCSRSSSFIRPCRTGVLIVCWCQGFTEFPQLRQVLRRKQRRKLFCRSVFLVFTFFVCFVLLLSLISSFPLPGRNGRISASISERCTVCLSSYLFLSDLSQEIAWQNDLMLEKDSEIKTLQSENRRLQAQACSGIIL